jgi:hypothetical protein
MKIAEETGDGDLKEAAKVNFGMANASMKWTNHVSTILNNLQDSNPEAGPLGALNEDDEDEGEGVFEGAENDLKLPNISNRTQ